MKDIHKWRIVARLPTPTPSSAVIVNSADNERVQWPLESAKAKGTVDRRLPIKLLLFQVSQLAKRFIV